MTRIEGCCLDGSEYLRRCSSFTDQPQSIDELVELLVAQTSESLSVDLQHVWGFGKGAARPDLARYFPSS